MFCQFLRLKLWKYTQQYLHPQGRARTCFLPIPLNFSCSSIYDKWTVWLVKGTASKHRQDARSSLKIRISHKPGLGLLHKFILSADGAHVFLILPPEFQVCQERSEAAKEIFFLARNRMSLSCLGGRELALFWVPRSRISHLALSLTSGGDVQIQCTLGEWGIQPATPRKHIFKQERFS